METPAWPDTGQYLSCPSCGDQSPSSPDLFALLETWGESHENECARSAERNAA